MKNTLKNYQIAPLHDEIVDLALAPYPEFQRKLLARRGIDTREKAEIFLNPNYEDHIHDPFLIKDMSKAVDRILLAIKNEEKILIYSDYDHDGIPGGVILHDFFKKIEYKHFSNYIPHRHLEGYGLHVKAIEGFAKDEVTLLITVDCGISDNEQVARANELGIDVIITDHHLTPKVLPEAFAILNSKQTDDEYPDKMLCGAGVAFKLVQGLVKRGDFNLVVGWEKWLLDLVALSTIADMVPLQGENRALAHFGLRVMRKSPRLGLNKLLRKMKMRQDSITEDDVGFMVAPRINAASRMGEPKLAFDMLATSDEIVADLVTDELDKLNNERKGVVASVVKEIKHILEKQEILPSVIVMGNPLWRPALLGLTANTVMESFNRPVFLWGRSGGEDLKGSCRSDGNIDVVALMASVDKEIIKEYGGHKMAGGFSVSHEKIHLLEQSLAISYERLRNQNEAEKIITIDGTLLLDQVNWNTYKMIEQLAPFGIDNPKPTFLFEMVMVVGLKRFGKEANHLELTFLNEVGKKIVAIGFFMNEESFFVAQVQVGVKINLIATMEKSTFRNFPELRLRIVDIT